MTREEVIKEVARNRANQYSHHVEWNDCYKHWIEGAKWADANPDRNTFACISLISAEQARKQMIEKACEWLQKNADTYIGVEGLAILHDAFFEDFRKAMEE